MDLPSLLNAALLGVVEGLTEFIPVSSTGHLLVAERLLGYRDPGGVFTVTIQLGAILAVVLLFWQRLIPPIFNLLAAGEVGVKARQFATSVVIATLPGVVIGLPADKWMESHILTPAIAPAVVALTFVLGGLAILLIEKRKQPAVHQNPTLLPWKVALIIGLCQVLAAVFPGTSRSGATIMGALLCGVARPAAAEFSFFLAIPAMLGGSLIKIAKHHHELTADRVGDIAVGFVVAFIVAFVVIRWLIQFVQNHTFVGFAWYRLIAGVLLAAALAAGLLPAPLAE